MSPGDEAVAPRVLRGWKEISSYIGTSPRTAQRYAVEAGLPVHRPGGRASVSAFEDELTEWMRGLTVPSRPAGLETGPATDNASTGPSRAPDGTSGTGVRVVAALGASICLACIGAFWVLRSPVGAVVPHVASFKLQVGVAGAGPFQMKVSEGHPAAIEFDSSSISVVAGRATGGLHVVFYDGAVRESGPGQPPLAEVTLPFPGTSARPVRVTWPRGALDLAWIGH